MGWALPPIHCPAVKKAGEQGRPIPLCLVLINPMGTGFIQTLRACLSWRLWKYPQKKRRRRNSGNPQAGQTKPLELKPPDG